MTELVERTQQVAARAAAVIDTVCGACGNSCCYQGTMMGSHDVLRLVKGLRLEPGRETILREGLAERAQQLRAELETLVEVRRLLAASSLADQSKLAELDASLADWESFCNMMEGSWEANVATLQAMLRYAGVRAVALRAVAQFPGAQAALSTLGKAGAGFKFRGRKLAPPRCLFHSLQRGCLAGPWKPGKCANFFCSGDPNLLRELRARFSFDDFVLSNARVLGPEAALKAVEVELELGREFVEPKVFIGPSVAWVESLLALLRFSYAAIVELPDSQERFMQSRAEVDRALEALRPDQMLLVRTQAIDGAALYELAIALDRRRAAGEAVAFVLVADDFVSPSPLPHPLWADEEMSQPLGSLDLYVVSEPDPA